MSAEVLKNKIKKSLDEMDEIHLKHAYDILKQIVQQQKYANIKIDRHLINSKLNKGIEQLDNNEGSDFRLFLNEMQEKYAKKKQG
jgi:hypothetical protein